MAFTKTYVWLLMTFVFIIDVFQPTLGAPAVPCLFIFGDSLVDSGNNNNLNTTSKANFPPYGVDFPHGPTGRFTNGRTIMDFIGESLGFEDFIPPFANTTGHDITKGVNYGSGGAGIRDESGKQLGDNISFDKQIQNHQTTISYINSLLANTTSTQDYLSKCLYAIDIGNNDYINNYFVPEVYWTSKQYTPEQYAAVLTQQYSQQLQALHKYGARRFALFGLGPSGCTPFMISRYPTNTCVNKINEAILLFNQKLVQLVDDLNINLPQSKFIFVNVSTTQAHDLALIGIQIVNTPCCNASEAIGLCIPGAEPCPVRTLNLFFDRVHPSETVNLLTATRAYQMLSLGDNYPTDIRHLIEE